MKKEKITVYSLQLLGRLMLPIVTKMENSLEGMYKLLHCDMVEALDIPANGKTYTLWCDEEGKLKDNQVYTLFVGEPQPGRFDIIAGPVLFTKTGPDGENCGLNAEDIENIKNYVSDAAMKMQKAIAMGLI